MGLGSCSKNGPENSTKFFEKNGIHTVDGPEVISSFRAIGSPISLTVALQHLAKSSLRISLNRSPCRDMCYRCSHARTRPPEPSLICLSPSYGVQLNHQL